MTGKIKSNNDTSIELEYCIVHNFGSVSKDSIRQKEHITKSDTKCKFVKYNPKKHNPKYEDSQIKIQYNDDEKPTPTKRVLDFAQSKILKTVRSFGNHTNVYGIIKINYKYKVLFLGSTQCVQWLKSTYFEYSGKIHSNDLYKNALGMIIAQSITNEISIQKIYNRIAFVSDEIFYNLCNDDYEIVKITTDGYSIIKNDIDNPLFRRKSSPRNQPIPKKSKNRNPLNELIKLLRIPIENKQLFKIHLTSFFLEEIPIPIMIIHGEQGSAKSTITSTVKRIVDPDPMNRASMPDSIDDMNIHFFNRYLTNFDNISYIDHKNSDNMCKGITGNIHNKRELYSDDGEVVLNIKCRLILNGVTPNVEYPDLMDRSIFYENKYIPKSERITEKEFNNKIDELLPYLLDQIFQTLSKSLKIYDSIKSEITKLERMADFTVFGECISQSLGYEKLSFIEAYSNNLKSNSLNSNESWPVINIILDIARKEGKDFEITVDDMYKKITNYAYENNINTKSQFSKFPRDQKALSMQIVRLSPAFRNFGYDISSYRYKKRDGIYKHNDRIFKITSTSTPFSNSISNGKLVDPVDPVDPKKKQAQNKENLGQPTNIKVDPVDSKKKVTNQTKNNQKNTTGSSVGQSDKKLVDPKKPKSTPKNTTGSVGQLGQAKTQSFRGAKKSDTSKNNKRYSHFKCQTCNAGEFGIGEKGINKESILQFHKKAGHSIHYFNKEGKSS